MYISLYTIYLKEYTVYFELSIGSLSSLGPKYTVYKFKKDTFLKCQKIIYLHLSKQLEICPTIYFPATLPSKAQHYDPEYFVVPSSSHSLVCYMHSL